MSVTSRQSNANYLDTDALCEEAEAAMSCRLKVNDIIIHRTYGRAIVQALYLDIDGGGPQARIRVFGERAPRRVWLHDCEKEPAPLGKPAGQPLRLVR